MTERNTDPETNAIRVFFAIFPNKFVRQQLALQAEKLEPFCGGRKIRIPHFHLTLVFLGDLSICRIETLRQIMKNISAKKFELNLDKVGYWKHNQIIYLQAKQFPTELFALVEALKTALYETGFSFDARVYKPHITLIRKAKHPINTDLIKPILWHVNQWSLIQSKPMQTGIDYVPLGHWLLK